MEHRRIAASRVSGPPLQAERRFARSTRMSARIPRVNLLVIGPEDAVDEVLSVVTRDLKPAAAPGDGTLVGHWRPGKPFLLPLPSRTGTLILRDVDTLVDEDQRKLVAWLEEAAGCVQVVSTASTSLMPLVEAGVFMQTLYYRLNTIYMDLTGKRFTPGDW